MSNIDRPLPATAEDKPVARRGFGEAAARLSRWTSVFLRLGALLIDGILLFCLFWAVTTITAFALLGLLYFAVILILFLAILSYHPLMEVYFGGSLGKKLLGLTVVNKDGERIGGGQAFIRAAFALLEFSPLLLLGLFAFILALVTPTRQRVGDIYASTFVVKRSDLEQAKHDHMLATFA